MLCNSFFEIFALQYLLRVLISFAMKVLHISTFLHLRLRSVCFASHFIVYQQEIPDAQNVLGNWTRFLEETVPSQHWNFPEARGRQRMGDRSLYQYSQAFVKACRNINSKHKLSLFSFTLVIAPRAQDDPRFTLHGSGPYPDPAKNSNVVRRSLLSNIPKP